MRGSPRGYHPKKMTRDMTQVHPERPPVYARCDKKATKDIKRMNEIYLLKLPYSESLFFKLTFCNCKSNNQSSVIYYLTMKLALQVTVLAIIGAAASAHELRGSPLSVRL